MMSGMVDEGGRRGQRRSGSQQDDSEYSTGRPSAPATLFDFVTSKMPQSSSQGILSHCFSVNVKSTFQNSKTLTTFCKIFILQLH